MVLKTSNTLEIEGSNKLALTVESRTLISRPVRHLWPRGLCSSKKCENAEVPGLAVPPCAGRADEVAEQHRVSLPPLAADFGHTSPQLQSCFQTRPDKPARSRR